jgi:hypothetical protein
MKIVKTIILAILFIFFASWFYKIVVLMFLAHLWRRDIKAKEGWGYKAIMIVLLLSMFCVLPRYRFNTSDRVQLIYQDKNGIPEYPPITQYLINVFFPEEEICNFGIWAARIVPNLIPVNNWILEEFTYDDKKGNIGNFYRPFNRLNWNGLFMMSGTTSQVCNMIGIDNTQSVYLIKPKNYNENKEYPIVFFMHGFLGNWKLYTGILKGLEDCIVLCVGTKTWSGIYTKHDINSLFAKQIPFLENLGYKIDENNLHIMGLSNGGSAVNVAYNNFSNKFKTITFISTRINQTYPISSKVLLIGGGKDHSSSSLHSAYRTLKSNETETDLYWNDEDSHFIFVNRADEIIEFMNKNLR